MKKLKLNLDDLKVESFNTLPTKTESKGTAFANATVLDPTCEATCADTCADTCATCVTCETCEQTCPNTCDQTCDCGTWNTDCTCDPGVCGDSGEYGPCS